MSKPARRVLTPDQFAHLLHVIKEHRYPEKNTALRRTAGLILIDDDRRPDLFKTLH